MLDELPFKRIVAIDFEFNFGGHASKEAAGRSGERPRVVCMVAKELRSGREWRIWRGEFGSTPPFDIGPDTLAAGYSLWADLTCFRQLDWRFPVHVFDQHTA